MDIEERLKEFDKLPRFADGRINYKNSKRALVINCFVKYRDKILLLKRSDRVAAYKGKWNSVGGYLDEPVPVKEKIMKELKEELDIGADLIKKITILEPLEIADKEINKTWITYPALAELRVKPSIKLDFEHTEYAWILPKDIKNYDTILGLKSLLNKLLNNKK